MPSIETTRTLAASLGPPPARGSGPSSAGGWRIDTLARDAADRRASPGLCRLGAPRPARLRPRRGRARSRPRPPADGGYRRDRARADAPSLGSGSRSRSCCKRKEAPQGEACWRRSRSNGPRARLGDRRAITFSALQPAGWVMVVQPEASIHWPGPRARARRPRRRWSDRYRRRPSAEPFSVGAAPPAAAPASPRLRRLRGRSGGCGRAGACAPSSAARRRSPRSPRTVPWCAASAALLERGAVVVARRDRLEAGDDACRRGGDVAARGGTARPRAPTPGSTGSSRPRRSAARAARRSKRSIERHCVGTRSSMRSASARLSSLKARRGRRARRRRRDRRPVRAPSRVEPWSNGSMPCAAALDRRRLAGAACATTPQAGKRWPLSASSQRSRPPGAPSCRPTWSRCPLADFTRWVDDVLEREDLSAAGSAPPTPTRCPVRRADVVITPLARAMLRPFAAAVLPGADDRTARRLERARFAPGAQRRAGPEHLPIRPPRARWRAARLRAAAAAAGGLL